MCAVLWLYGIAHGPAWLVCNHPGVEKGIINLKQAAANPYYHDNSLSFLSNAKSNLGAKVQSLSYKYGANVLQQSIERCSVIHVVKCKALFLLKCNSVVQKSR